jgi:hypothetical protein
MCELHGCLSGNSKEGGTPGAGDFWDLGGDAKVQGMSNALAVGDGSSQGREKRVGFG